MRKTLGGIQIAMAMYLAVFVILSDAESKGRTSTYSYNQ